jgi:D-beta-D-heptose 7-phosphate kinase/D-beta-D-heptose 1-phosphate adenosyltransferase
VPTTAREVYDVVGAGDTVTAYLATMLAAGATPLEAAVIANYAAGVEVGKLGAATVSPAEVLEAFDAHLSDLRGEH